MSRRLAIMSRLPRVNPDDSSPYPEQANVRPQNPKPLERFRAQMAAAARQAARERLAVKRA